MLSNKASSVRGKCHQVEDPDVGHLSVTESVNTRVNCLLRRLLAAFMSRLFCSICKDKAFDPKFIERCSMLHHVAAVNLSFPLELATCRPCSLNDLQVLVFECFPKGPFPLFKILKSSYR